MFTGLHVKYPLFLSDFNETWSFHDGVSKNSPISGFTNNRRVGAELFHADGQTDMTKLIFAFHIFVNAPNDSIFYIGPQREHNVHTCQRPTSECYMAIKA